MAQIEEVLITAKAYGVVSGDVITVNIESPEAYFERERRSAPRRTITWSLGPVGRAFQVLPLAGRAHHHHPHQEGTPDMSFALKDDQKVEFSVTGADKHGHSVPLTGTPVFSVDRPDLLALVDNGDGSGSVSATGELGTAVLSVNDTESDGGAFVGSVSIDILPDDVASVGINLGAPTDVTEEAPVETPTVETPPVETPDEPAPPADETPVVETPTSDASSLVDPNAPVE